MRGLADGSLPRERFAFYVGQDATFLDAFARAYALALAKSESRDELFAWQRLLAGAVDELRLHESYAARWGVDLAPSAAPATLAYTSFLFRVASSEPGGHVAAAMAPCMRLYAWLGQQLDPVAVGPYREWVDTYADPEFDALACSIEALIAGDGAVIGAHYRQAMELELAFFDAAWQS